MSEQYESLAEGITSELSEFKVTCANDIKQLDVLAKLTLPLLVDRPREVRLAIHEAFSKVIVTMEAETPFRYENLGHNIKTLLKIFAPK